MNPGVLNRAGSVEHDLQWPEAAGVPGVGEFDLPPEGVVDLDAAAQYRAVRYAERPAAESAVASVGAKGDSYDNALAEALNSLFKAELVRNKGPWRDMDHLEIAVAEWVYWYNHRRLHGEIVHVPPAEYEELHATTVAPEMASNSH